MAIACLFSAVCTSTTVASTGIWRADCESCFAGSTLLSFELRIQLYSWYSRVPHKKLNVVVPQPMEFAVAISLSEPENLLVTTPYNNWVHHVFTWIPVKCIVMNTITILWPRLTWKVKWISLLLKTLKLVHAKLDLNKILYTCNKLSCCFGGDVSLTFAMCHGGP